MRLKIAVSVVRFRPWAPSLRSTPAVAELARRRLEEYARPHKKPSGFAQDRRYLENRVIPLNGSLQVSEVEREDIVRAMREAAGETARNEKNKNRGRRIVRGEIVANRVHALLSKMFELAEDWKYLPPGCNPCRGAKRFAERKGRTRQSSQVSFQWSTGDASPALCAAIHFWSSATWPLSSLTNSLASAMISESSVVSRIML